MIGAIKILLLLAGLGAAAGGAVVTFAYGMSDNPMDAEQHSNRSCAVAIVGVLTVIASVVWMVL